MSLRDFWRRQRVTRAGAAFLLAIVLVAGAAFFSANNLLFLILAAMVSTFLISGFVGRLGLAGLELDLLLPPHTSARRTVHAAVRVKNLKRYIPSFSIHLTPSLYFPLIPGGASTEEPLELYFPRRGAHSQRNFRFSTRFPFGFVERSEEVTIRHEVIVYPCLDPRPGFGDFLAAVTDDVALLERGQGSDFYRIRPYEATESARHVDWKATAHTGALQIREFAREQSPAVVLCLDLDVAPDAAEWLEMAIECAAFVAFELAARGTRVHFRTQNFDVTTPDDADIYTILKHLALVAPTKGLLEVGGQDHGVLIVFTQDPQRFAAQGRHHAGSNIHFFSGLA